MQTSIYPINENVFHSFRLFSDLKYGNSLNTVLWFDDNINSQKHRAIFLALPSGFFVSF